MSAKPLMLNETGALIADATEKIAGALGLIAAVQSNNIGDITDWAQIRELVRANLGSQHFPVGTILTVHNEDYGDLALRVCAHNHHKNPLKPKAPTMTLEMQGAITFKPFDAIEAIYCAKQALSAGTYNITLLEGYDTTYDGDKTIQFTTTKEIPKNGQIVITGWGKNVNVSNAKISTYASADSTEAIESNLAISVGTAGTNLGTADGTDAANGVNRVERARYGNGNYRESAIRQWINSAGAAGEWWTPQNVWDRAPSYASNKAGLLAGMPQDFLSVIGEVDRKVLTNNTWENPSTCPEGISTDETYKYYTVRDKSFLFSRSEIHEVITDISDIEGTVLDYYKDDSADDRIKYDENNFSRHYWLQSPFIRSIDSAYYVDRQGSIQKVGPYGTVSGSTGSETVSASAAWVIY